MPSSSFSRLFRKTNPYARQTIWRVTLIDSCRCNQRPVFCLCVVEVNAFLFHLLVFWEVNIPLLSLCVPYKNRELDGQTSFSFIHQTLWLLFLYYGKLSLGFGLLVRFYLTLDEIIMSIYLHVLTIYRPNIELIICSLI